MGKSGPIVKFNGPFIRVCSGCGNEVHYTNRNSQRQSEKRGGMCRNCGQKAKPPFMKSVGDRSMSSSQFIRICRGCGENIYYRSEKTKQDGEHFNMLCLQCCHDTFKPIENGFMLDGRMQYRRECSECKDEVIHKTRSDFYEASCKNKPCGKCSPKYNIASRKSTKKPQVTEFHRVCQCGADIYYKSDRTYSYAKRRNLECRACLMSRTGIAPMYNKSACRFFDQLNEDLSWDGQHAENEGEFKMRSPTCWLDYYEPNLNIVIEWDERYHFTERNAAKDRVREQKIIKKLGCRFFRIDERDMSLKEVTLEGIINRPVDYLEELSKSLQYA